MFVLPKRRKRLLQMARSGMERMRAAFRRIMRNRLHHLVDWVKARYGREVSVLEDEGDTVSSFVITRFRLAGGGTLHMDVSLTSRMNEITLTLHPVNERSHLWYLVRDANGNYMMTNMMPRVAMDGEVRVLTDLSTPGATVYFRANRVRTMSSQEGLEICLPLKIMPMPKIKMLIRTLLGTSAAADDESLTPPMP